MNINLPFVKKFVDRIVVIYLFIIGLLILTLGACSKNKTIDDISIKNILFSEEVPAISLNEIFSSLIFIKLNTNTSSLVGDVNKVVLSGDSIFISTGANIYLFNKQGLFINKLSAIGKGPGEYLGISDILIDESGKKILLLNAGHQKVIEYDYNFKFIKEFGIDRYAMNFAMTADRTLLFYCGNDDGGSEAGKFLLFKDGKKISELKAIDRNRANYLHYRMFDFLGHYNNFITITDPHNDTVYYSDGKDILPRYVFDIGSKRIPNEIYANQYHDIADFSLNYLLGSDKAYGIFGYLESDSLQFLRFEERIKNNTPFGELKQYYILNHKSNSGYKVGNSLCLSKKITSKSRLPSHIVYYSQKCDNEVVFLLSASDVGEILKKTTGIKDEPLLDELRNQYESEMDNPFVFIGRLK